MTLSPATTVAPFAGAWIEIPSITVRTPLHLSLPSRERGLKSLLDDISDDDHNVAPFAGAWIEIYCITLYIVCQYSRSLRGSVD